MRNDDRGRATGADDDRRVVSRSWLAMLASEAPPRFATPEFLELQAAWYARLADEGFVDDEARCAAHYDGRLVREYDRGMPTQDYYRLAGWWLHDRVWPSRRAQRIWAAHAEGVTARATGARLSPMPAVSRSACGRVVQAEAAAMAEHYRNQVRSTNNDLP